MKLYQQILLFILSVSLVGQETAIDSLYLETISDTSFTYYDNSSTAIDSIFDDPVGDDNFFEFSSDTVGSDTIDYGDIFMDDTSAIEEEVLVDAGAELEAFLTGEESELLVGSQLIGYTAGIDLSAPVFRYGGLGLSFNNKGIAEGFVLNSPFGTSIGPYEIGLGLQFGNYSFIHKVTGELLGGVYILVTANTSVYETPNGTVSTQVGAGMFGKSIGITVGAAYDYAVPNYPLVVRPYFRGNSTLDSGLETKEGTPAYTWFNLGIMTSYDLSILTHQITSSELYKDMKARIVSLFDR